jgi:hypothetical protein
MKNEFVPYDIALDMKDLGFDEPCLALYVGKSKKLTNKNTPFSLHKDVIKLNTPLYQQAFRWFREEHNLKAYIQGISKSSIDYEYRIIGVEHHIEWGTYEQVELECLRKLIEIVKEK